MVVLHNLCQRHNPTDFYKNKDKITLPRYKNSHLSSTTYCHSNNYNE